MESRLTKQKVLALCAGLVLPIGLYGAYRSVARETIDDKLAKAEGVPVGALREINRASDRMARGGNVSDEEWSDLVRFSHGANVSLREEAFDAIGNAYGSPRVGQALGEVRRMKDDPSHIVRSGYVFALVRLRAPDWRAAADAAAHDSDEVVREVSQDGVKRAEWIWAIQDKRQGRAPKR